jgi:hypothetical protein
VAPKSLNIAPPADTPRAEPSFGLSSPKPEPTAEASTADFKFDFGLNARDEVKVPDPAPEPEHQEPSFGNPAIGDSALVTGSATDAAATPSEPAFEPEIDPIGALIAEQLNLAPKPASDLRPQAELHPDPNAWRAPPPVHREPGQAAPGTKQGSADETPSDMRDPLDEIESLIGESVRVQQAAPAPGEPQRMAPHHTRIAQPQPQPADPELAAEAAILAAAAGSGVAPVAADPHSARRADSGFDDGLLRERPAVTEFEPVRVPNSGLRRILGPLFAVAVLAVIGGGIWWSMNQGGDGGDAPLLVADSDAVKDVPEAGAESGSESGSVVFSEMEGGADTGDAEQLVSRDETGGAVGGDVSRVISTADTGEEAAGLLNRRVRTVTVRPDGTIVSGDEALAGSEVLPVDRPNVPELPGDATTSATTLDDIGNLIAEEASASGEAVLAEVAPEVVAPAAADTTAPAAESEAVTEAAIINPALVAPIPLPRPADRAALAAAAAAAPALVASPTLQIGNNAAPGTIANPLPNPNANPGAVDLVGESTNSTAAAGTAAVVRVSSQSTQQAAQQMLVALQSRLTNILNGRQLQVRQVATTNGTIYRVELPTSSTEEAFEACIQIRATGNECLVEPLQ